jgi:hypothetical protein
MQPWCRKIQTKGKDRIRLIEMAVIDIECAKLVGGRASQSLDGICLSAHRRLGRKGAYS